MKESQPNLIEISPKLLEFNIPEVEGAFKQREKLEIKNISKEVLFLSVQSNKSQYYRVTPVHCVIKEGESRLVNVTLTTTNKIPEEDLKGHKFRIEAKIIPSDLKSEENYADIKKLKENYYSILCFVYFLSPSFLNLFIQIVFDFRIFEIF